MVCEMGTGAVAGPLQGPNDRTQVKRSEQQEGTKEWPS